MSTAVPHVIETDPLPPARSPARRTWNVFKRNRIALVGLALVILVVGASLAAPWIAWHEPLDQSTANRLKPPGDGYLLGRDEFGRDVFARLLYAGRISLLVGVSAVLIGGLFGTTVGILAAYTGGRFEMLIMRIIDILMAFPSLILGLVVMAVLGSGLVNLILAIGIVFIPNFARVVHAATLSIKEREFILAARAIGATHRRIMLRHILPNIMGELLVMGSLWTASAIRIEASLSFIGLGLDPSIPTWGNMIRSGTGQLLNAPWLSIYPGLAIFLTVLGFNLLGDGLRDIFDPRLVE